MLSTNHKRLLLVLFLTINLLLIGTLVNLYASHTDTQMLNAQVELKENTSSHSETAVTPRVDAEETLQVLQEV